MADTGLTKLKPVYLIWGKEELLLAQAVQRLRERVAEVADLDFNFDQFDAESSDASSVISAANTLPFASDRRLVVLRNVDKMNAAAQAELAAYATDPAPTACLVLVASSISRNGKLFKAVDALGGAAEYRAPRKNDYPSWVMSHFTSKGRQLSPDAAESLVRAVGRDLRKIDIEAEKIIAFAGDKARIEREDVEAVVSQTAPTSVFEFLDALGARDCGAALRLLADLVDGGESVMGVHAMAVRHVRMLLSVKALLDRDVSEREMASQVRAADWQVRNYARQARRFEEADLVSALRAAAETESQMKTGGQDPRLALERWVIEVCAK
ncbi:MAG: DNA polymerase III subunit delta [Coriobacteriia bacterium]|nr:DNA polymerase III subunit delta [Coriobacteriia bacterium]MBN2822667.1 DNA polymerase III subunit delta [Coriobacteriia bacterium]